MADADSKSSVPNGKQTITNHFPSCSKLPNETLTLIYMLQVAQKTQSLLKIEVGTGTLHQLQRSRHT